MRAALRSVRLFLCQDFEGRIHHVDDARVRDRWHIIHTEFLEIIDSDAVGNIAFTHGFVVGSQQAVSSLGLIEIFGEKFRGDFSAVCRGASRSIGRENATQPIVLFRCRARCAEIGSDELGCDVRCTFGSGG